MMVQLTIGLVAILFTAGVMASSMIWALIVAMLIFWKQFVNKTAEMIDIIMRDGYPRVAQKVQLWQNNRKFIFEGGTAGVFEAFAAKMHWGRGQRFKLKQGDYLVINGDSPQDTVCIRGWGNIMKALYDQINRLNTRLMQMTAERNHMVQQYQGLTNNFDIKVDAKTKQILDSVSQIQPYNPMKKVKS